MVNNKGAVLTGVILMVLVMTLIGVPLLGMVVYNYRLRELDNSLKRSEYENETAMDVVSVIVRKTVINAISYAKNNSTQKVNETAEILNSRYSSIYNDYVAKWINEYNLWSSGAEGWNEEVLAAFLTEKDSREVDWESADNTLKEEIKDIGRNAYVTAYASEELMEIQNAQLLNFVGDELDFLMDDSGKVDENMLNSAYDLVFKNQYQWYINEHISTNILTADRYIGIAENVFVADTELRGYSNYLTVKVPGIRGGNVMEVDVETGFKKNSNTPPTRLSSTFIIRTPAFDSVSSVTQESITLSNALLNQGGVVVGKKLTIGEGSTLRIANDLTVLGNDSDTAIELEKNASLVAQIDEIDGMKITKSRIATSGDIILNGGSLLTTGRSPIYFRNLYVGKPDDENNADITVNFSGDAVAEDDLEINHEGGVQITQDSGYNYYGFNDTNNKGPDSSSSIVLNSKVLTNKTLTLGNLYLAGRAFIENVRGTSSIPVVNQDGTMGFADTTYKTGESVAIKGNYIAYQTPLIESTDFSPDKMIFSTYFMQKKNNLETQHSPIRLVDGFAENTELENANFDVNQKWRYFKEYFDAYKDIGYGNLVKRINVDSKIIYTEGTAFDKDGNVVGSSNEIITDTSFRDNLATEYEKYTKYFGYRPINEDGTISEDAKENIFGEDGWIDFDTGSYAKSDISDIAGNKVGEYYLVYSKENKEITLSNMENKGIIICDGDLTINVAVGVDTKFSGIIIASGDVNVNINGGTLTLQDAKEEVINTVIGNYRGTNTDVTGTQGTVFNTFKYDNSGSTYIVTEIGDELININDLIGIKNWKKSSYGRL